MDCVGGNDYRHEGDEQDRTRSPSRATVVVLPRHDFFRLLLTPPHSAPLCPSPPQPIHPRSADTFDGQGKRNVESDRRPANWMDIHAMARWTFPRAGRTVLKHTVTNKGGFQASEPHAHWSGLGRMFDGGWTMFDTVVLGRRWQRSRGDGLKRCETPMALYRHEKPPCRGCICSFARTYDDDFIFMSISSTKAILYRCR
jgi:hypothetical protein